MQLRAVRVVPQVSARAIAVRALAVEARAAIAAQAAAAANGGHDSRHEGLRAATTTGAAAASAPAALPRAIPAMLATMPDQVACGISAKPVSTLRAAGEASRPFSAASWAQKAEEVIEAPSRPSTSHHRTST